MDFLIINPEIDTPINIIFSFFFLFLAIGAPIYLSRQEKKMNKENK